jgi:ABC-type glycerol-3-phosphate transport system permease component
MSAHPSSARQLADPGVPSTSRPATPMRSLATRTRRGIGRGLRRLRTRAGILAALPTVVVVVALTASAVELIHFTDKIWFWADDWDLLFRRGIIPGADRGLLEPHNGHWLTAHIVMYRAIFEIFGLSSYVPYACVEIAFHLAIAWTTYLLLRRVGAKAWAAVGAAVVIAFYGAGANAQIFAATMNHTGALLFGLLAAYCLARVDRDAQATVLAAACLLVSVMFSGTALAMLVMVAVFGAAHRGVRTAALTVAPAAAAFTLWYLNYGRGIEPWGGDPQLSQIPHYVWVGLTGTLADGSGLAGAGPVLLAALVVCLMVARPQEPPGLISLAGAGLAAVLVQLVLASIGRFNFGAEQLGLSHYAYINVVLLSPAIGLALHLALGGIRRSPWIVAILATLLIAAYTSYGWTKLVQWHNDFALLTSANDELTMGIRDAYEQGEAILTDKPLSDIDGDYLPSYVVAPEIRAALPHRPADPVWRLEAESRFFVGVGPDDYSLAQPGRVEVVSGLKGRGDVDDPGCHKLTATAPEPVLEVYVEAGQEIVVWSSSTTVKTKLYRDDLEGSLHEWPVEEGPVHIATSARDTQMLVAFNGTGSYTVCTG